MSKKTSRLKSAVRFLHLWLGLISGLVVFIVAITGCIYAFEEEARSLIHKDLQQVTVSSEEKCSLDSVLKSARLYAPGQKVKNIKTFSDPTRSVIVNLRNNTSIYVDPYTAKVIGTLDTEREFLAVVLKIHRSLYLGEPGKMITGASALIFLTMLITGMILWWPGRKKNLKQKFRFSLKASRKRLTYDLHSVLGFYASWIILFTVLTGLIWSYKWMESGMYAITGSVKEMAKMKSPSKDTTATLSIENIFQQSIALSPNTSEQFILLPEDAKGIVKVNMRYASGGFFTKNDQFFFDRYSGKKLKELRFENSSTGDKMKATNYNIHTGKVLGFPGQLLVFFASLISASLPITGFMFWWGKRKEKKD